MVLKFGRLLRWRKSTEVVEMWVPKEIDLINLLNFQTENLHKLDSQTGTYKHDFI